MEQFFNWIDHVSQGIISKQLLMSFKWIDWLAIGFMFFGVLGGMKKGLMRQAGLIAETCVVIYIVFQYYGTIASVMSEYVPKAVGIYLETVIYLLALILIYFIMLFVDGLLKKGIQTTLVGPVRVLGGAILGLFHSLMVLSLLCQAILLLPIRSVIKNFEPGHSYFGPTVAKLAPTIEEGMQRAIDGLMLGVQPPIQALPKK